MRDGNRFCSNCFSELKKMETHVEITILSNLKYLESLRHI